MTDVFSGLEQQTDDSGPADGTKPGWKLAIAGTVLVAAAGAVIAIVAATGGFAAVDPAAHDRAMARCIDEQTSRFAGSNPSAEQLATEGCALLDDDQGTLLERFGD